MRICICDDDIGIHNTIVLLLKTFITTETQFNITDVYSGEELLKYYSIRKKFDIIFLDVEMAQINGLKTAEKIRKTDPKAIIIFVSSHANYVFDVFRLEALHFIVKPICHNEFTDVFQRAMTKYRAINSTVSLKWQNVRFQISINDIIYVEGYKRHITVHTKDEEYESIGKIPDMLEILEPHGFVRIHQGFIVNMDYIKRFDANDVILKDNTKVMVSVRKRTEALKAYDTYLQKWKW